MDQEDVLWVIGQKGRIFRYDSQHDKFELAYVHPELIRNKFQAFLDYGYLDKNDHIWLCYKDTITWYNICTGTTQHMPKPVDGAICITILCQSNYLWVVIKKGYLYMILVKPKKSLLVMHQTMWKLIRLLL